jgi:hypothetical protein
LPSGTILSVPYNATADSVASVSASYVWHSLSVRTHWRNPVPSRSVMNIRALP